MEIPVVSDEDRAEYRRFVSQRLPLFLRRPVPEIWHYTTAEGLIGILRTGSIFFTQVSCLNDNLEQRHFGDLIHTEIKSSIAQNEDARLAPLLQTANAALIDRDFSATAHFAACFSEVEDDLGQWRGYGGGECGYAIGFDIIKLDRMAQTRRPGTILVPMNYHQSDQVSLAKEVVEKGKTYFRTHASGAVVPTQIWATEFLNAFWEELDIFATMLKHPKFESEREWRLATKLGPRETSQLEFRQKRTLLARHLPVQLTNNVNPLLPITRIFVGPSPAQRVSQISVGDLLVKFGYDIEAIRVERSKVPYRVP